MTDVGLAAPVLPLVTDTLPVAEAFRHSVFRAPLLDTSAVWVSATPFVVTRYPKTRGTKRDRPEDHATPRDFALCVLRQEIERLRQRRADVPAVERIEAVDVLGGRVGKPVLPGGRVGKPVLLQFKRGRRKASDDGGRRASGAFCIVFAAPARGPICLGHSCHFGLGLFLPEAVE